MMEFDNELNDEQLSEMLRQVAVPDNLKQQLKEIASDTVERREETPGHRNGFPSSLWVLAASLAAVATVVGITLWVNSPDPDSTLADGPVMVSPAPRQGAPPESSSAPPNPDRSAASRRLADHTDTMDDIESRLELQEIARLEARLNELQQAEHRLQSLEDVDSVVLAVADQTVMPLGGRPQRAEAAMSQIISRYPDTRGAQMAREFLERQTN